MYATGQLAYDASLSAYLPKTIFWLLFCTHVREPHFYILHRVMHPWRLKYLPDFGEFLYKWVHSLHHKSYNTTAFSGTNMHPIEATGYYSCCFLAVPFGCHPAIPLAIMIDAGVGAWLGHGGFNFPGTGDYFHHIHHVAFDANFGTSNIPIDWLMGTFAATEDDVHDIWRGDKVGMKNNKTSVHKSRKDQVDKIKIH